MFTYVHTTWAEKYRDLGYVYFPMSNVIIRLTVVFEGTEVG